MILEAQSIPPDPAWYIIASVIGTILLAIVGFLSMRWMNATDNKFQQILELNAKEISMVHARLEKHEGWIIEQQRVLNTTTNQTNIAIALIQGEQEHGKQRLKIFEQHLQDVRKHDIELEGIKKDRDDYLEKIYAQLSVLKGFKL